MRKAGDWYFPGFHPESAADIIKAIFSEQGNLFRMVAYYLDIAAGRVNPGGSSLDFSMMRTASNGAFLRKLNHSRRVALHVFAKLHEECGKADRLPTERP